MRKRTLRARQRVRKHRCIETVRGRERYPYRDTTGEGEGGRQREREVTREVTRERERERTRGRETEAMRVRERGGGRE